MHSILFKNASRSVLLWAKEWLSHIGMKKKMEGKEMYFDIVGPFLLLLLFNIQLVQTVYIEDVWIKALLDILILVLFA